MPAKRDLEKKFVNSVNGSIIVYSVAKHVLQRKTQERWTPSLLQTPCRFGNSWLELHYGRLCWAVTSLKWSHDVTWHLLLSPVACVKGFKEYPREGSCKYFETYLFHFLGYLDHMRCSRCKLPARFDVKKNNHVLERSINRRSNQCTSSSAKTNVCCIGSPRVLSLIHSSRQHPNREGRLSGELCKVIKALFAKPSVQSLCPVF